LLIIRGDEGRANKKLKQFVDLILLSANPNRVKTRLGVIRYW